MPLFPVINIATFSRNVPVTIGPNWRTKRGLLPGLCMASSQAFSVKAYRWHNRETLRYCKTSNKNVQLARNLFCSVAVERMRVQLATFKPVWQQIRLLQAVVRKFVIESRDWENLYMLRVFPAQGKLVLQQVTSLPCTAWLPPNVIQSKVSAHAKCNNLIWCKTGLTGG